MAKTLKLETTKKKEMLRLDERKKATLKPVLEVNAVVVVVVVVVINVVR